MHYTVGGDMMPYKIKVSENLSRDKSSGNRHRSYEDTLAHGKSINLRGNSRFVGLQNGYGKILPIDKLKIFKPS